VRETVEQGSGGQNEPIEWQRRDHPVTLRLAQSAALFLIELVRGSAESVGHR